MDRSSHHLEITPEALMQLGETIRSWVMESRRDSNTWLVTMGHILKPPFMVRSEIENSLLKVKISGSNDILTMRLNSVVDSDFRDQLGLFLLDENGVVRDSHIVAPFTRHLQLILEAFPPNSRFKTEELYAKVTWSGDSTRAQAHARRRWKELKYSYGFDLDWDGKMYWRGPDPVPVREPALRPDDNKLRERFWSYLAEESRKKEADELAHCAYCGIRVISRDDNETDAPYEGIGLIDHRRPVYQGGDDSRNNLQILCQTCNNLKNSTCRKCPYGFKCDDCVWAYPEKAKSRRLTIHLSQQLLDALTARAKGGSLDSVVTEILSRAALEKSQD